jgi:N-acyl-D-aspartate/D-glutamate deacylase
MDYDLKITGGTIIGGTGRAQVTGDIATKDGKIIVLGEAPGKARETIDARGKIAALGLRRYPHALRHPSDVGSIV